jgi:trans-2,3-dihydro-3-hydroxyanthranilate isomerase
MTERTYRFVQVDVFTDRVFGGNPLAVVPDARGITDAEMQAIAREMNLSETTFVLPSTREDCVARVRIFTPGSELPFAGHPTIGTSYVLAREGLLPSGAAEIALEEGVGPVPVRFEGDPSAPTFAWMTHGAARFGPAVADRAAVAAALGLRGSDLLPDAPVCSGSTGLEFLYVPLRDVATVDRVSPDSAAISRIAGEGERPRLFVFAPDPGPGAGRVYSRMFSGDLPGIPEDPATGSASGPLGAYLVQHELVRTAPEVRIVSEQGTHMGRQSFIHIHLRTAGEQITSIEVGGSTVPVLEGTLRLP